VVAGSFFGRMTAKDDGVPLLYARLEQHVDQGRLFLWGGGLCVFGDVVCDYTCHYRQYLTLSKSELNSRHDRHHQRALDIVFTNTY
jgi:hypothetical protein